VSIEQGRQAIRTLKALGGTVQALVHPDDVDRMTDEDTELLDEEGVELVVTEDADRGGIDFVRGG
jgi:hypothetical protein